MACKGNPHPASPLHSHWASPLHSHQAVSLHHQLQVTAPLAAASVLKQGPDPQACLYLERQALLGQWAG